MKTHYKLFIILIALLGTNKESFATHAAALDLSYTCFGNNQYQFVATFYRDCSGIAAPDNLPLDISSISCNFADSTNYTMQLVYSTQGTDTISHLAGLCPGLNSKCVGGNYAGYEQYIYAVTVVLPFNCSDWVIDTHISARNDAITNLQNPGDQDLFVECHFSNAGGLCDNSPIFTTIPLAYSCVNGLFLYNHGAFDPDGDSLVYTLVNPLHDHNVPISYSDIDLSPTYPLFTVDGTFGFDPLTGQMSCTPSAIQIVVISVLIDEYRNGVKLGSVQRDLQIVVKTCNNNVPEIPNGIVNVTGGILVDSTTVQVCPGALLNFDLIGVDQDATNHLTMTSNLPITIPGASYTVNGDNPDTMHIEWQTSVSDTGFYVFTVTIKDDGCPISGQQIYSYTIKIGSTPVDAGPDLQLCVTDPQVELHVDGLAPYLWNNAPYLDNTTSSDPLATLPGLGNYEFIVTANVGNYCEANDTVMVTVNPDFVSDVTNFPDTLCSGQQVALNANASGGLGNFVYEWSSIPGGFSSNQAATTDQPEVPTFYIVTTSSGGCVHKDTAFVVTRNLPNPSFVMDSTLCEGVPTAITYVGGAGSGYVFTLDFGNGNVQSGSGSGPYNVSWNTTGTWEVYLNVTDVFGCAANDTASVIVNPNPQADFSSEQGGCEPYTVTFDNESAGGASYLWDFGDGTSSGEMNPTHTYSAGVYTVTLTTTNSFGCVSTITQTDYIRVLPVPEACFTVQEDITVVYDISQATFHFLNCSLNATSYLWDFGDSTSSTEENPTHTYTYTDTFYVTLTALNEYCSDTEKIGPIIVVYFHLLYFPGAFSPNLDGTNDYFHEIGGAGITSLYYAVYNRWGEVVYETTDQNSQGWDGIYKGKKSDVGVYIWFAEATFVSGDRFNFKGNVTLVR